MKIENIKQDELNLIIEALLFSSTLDVSADWSQKVCSDMIELAYQLNNKCELKNIELCKEENSENYLMNRKIKNQFNIKVN